MKKYFRSIVFSFITSLGAVEPANVEPIVILGSGVGSLTSALYLGRAGFSPLVIEGPNPGGQLTQSHMVQNWPGELEISGQALVEKMRDQTIANGARLLNEEVIAVDFSKRPFKITTRILDGSEKTRELQAESCIIAMGTKPNFLSIPGEQTYWGKGVTNCAICDGSLYKNKIVGVVGGGDSAVLEALYLSNIAKEVHVFVRKSSFRPGEEKRVEILRQKENVKFHFNTSVEQVLGNTENVTGVVLKNGKDKHNFALDGVFLAIGSKPNTHLFQNALKLDKEGYIALKKDQQTFVEGVYAIGDIVDPIYKQAVSAAGDGAKAALQVQQYLINRQPSLAMKPAVKEKEVAVLGEVIEVKTIEQFQSELENTDIPVFVDFYATWCSPCKRVSPIIDSSANALSGKVKFLKVNVDLFADLSHSYNVKAMPTVVLLDASGNELERKVGLDQISDLLKQLQADH